MFGRSERRRADELRSKFVANREKVRSWVADWDSPEVVWPDVPAVPHPWVVSAENERTWFQRHAPFLREYQWFLEARPLVEGVSRIAGNWRFAAGHEFEGLEINTRTVADPGYLADRLAFAVHAAALKGWTAADAQPVHDWLFEGLDSRPMEHGVRGQNRQGFVLLDFLRVPLSRTEIGVRLSVTLTSTALDGSPLTSDGRTSPS
jgi:hypothetical protein